MPIVLFILLLGVLAWLLDFALAWLGIEFAVFLDILAILAILFACFVLYKFIYFLLYRAVTRAVTSDFLKKVLARLGYVPAQMFWGARYYGQDYEKAFYWYKQAATRENTLAQDIVALMYDEGLGVLKNYDQANHQYKKVLSMYKKHAEQGDTWAQYRIAQYYIRFEVKENYIEAYKWLVLTKSVVYQDRFYSKGYEEYAQHSIEELEAYQWYILAKIMTDKHHEKINEYSKYREYCRQHPGHDHGKTNEYLKFLEEQMTDSQIAKAQNLAQQFQKKH